MRKPCRASALLIAWLTLEPWPVPRLARAPLRVRPRTEVVRASDDEIRLSDGARLRPDRIVYACGYKADLGRVPYLDGLDIVVINAAGCPVVPIDEMTEDAYDRYMAVHAKGPFFLIQHAGRTLRDGGRLIAISTLNTRLHPPGGALYTGAKGALENFTKVAAIEFGRRGITANVVSPGATDTEMLRAANPGDTFEGTAARTALRRLGQPGDIAPVVAFLAGPDSGWISGQNLAADGGLLR